jgi:hypothetical protein
MEKAMSKSMLSRPRTLKVHDVGDYYRKEVIPQIRLQGKWLLSAGLQPDTQVQVTNPREGVLVVKSLH